MLVSRARLGFLSVPFLRWYLAHAWFFSVFHYYVGISRTLGFFLVLHYYVGISRMLGFFLVFHCYVGISCTLGFFWCSIVMLVSRVGISRTLKLSLLSVCYLAFSPDRFVGIFYYI